MSDITENACERPSNADGRGLKLNLAEQILFLMIERPSNADGRGLKHGVPVT